MKTQFRQRIGEMRRLHAVRLRGPLRWRRGGGRNRELVRDTDAVDGFSRMARVPAHGVTALAGLRQNIPQRFAFACAARGGPQGRAVRSRLSKSMDAVKVRSFAGRD